ncbi:MAG: tetratricopeptide repeat protein [bacterium]|nr:tetratricopeptide repeat protein [bacterium]
MDEHDGRSSTDYYKRFKEKFSNRDFDGGLDDLAKAVNLDPTNVELYIERADLNMLRAEYQEAVDDLTKIMDLNPEIMTLADAYDLRARAYELLGESEKAIADCTWVIEHGQATHQTFSRRGRLTERQGNYQDAIRDFTAAYNMQPDPLALLQRAALYSKVEQYQEAINDLSIFISDYPNTAYEITAYGLRAVAYQKVHMYPEALSDFEYIVNALGEEPLYIHFCIGLVYEKMGLMDKAIDEFRKSTLNPDHADYERISNILNMI